MAGCEMAVLLEYIKQANWTWRSNFFKIVGGLMDNGVISTCARDAGNVESEAYCARRAMDALHWPCCGVMCVIFCCDNDD